MRVFISWSGDLSKQLGEAIRNWLPSTLQYVEPYFTPSDIEKGAKWATEISAELAETKICIIILTRDNLDSEWIMFEAGAISTVVEKARVCPIVFDMEPTDVKGPLAQFQATKFIEDDFSKLIFAINSAAGDQKLKDERVRAVFKKWWPDLETDVKAILNRAKTSTALKPTAELRTEKDLLEETLLLMRNLTSSQRNVEKNMEGLQSSLGALKDLIGVPSGSSNLGTFSSAPSSVPSLGTQTSNAGVGPTGTAGSPPNPGYRSLSGSPPPLRPLRPPQRMKESKNDAD
jgi:hypothetical protein